MYLSPPRRATTEQMARSSRFCCWRRYGCRSGCIRVCEFANGMSVHCLMHPYEKRMTVLRFDLPVIFLLLFLGGKRDGAHHTQHTHTHTLACTGNGTYTAHRHAHKYFPIDVFEFYGESKHKNVSASEGRASMCIHMRNWKISMWCCICERGARSHVCYAPACV